MFRPNSIVYFVFKSSCILEYAFHSTMGFPCGSVIISNRKLQNVSRGSLDFFSLMGLKLKSGLFAHSSITPFSNP